MLLRFGIQNHRSIRDYQEISFARSALAGPEHVTVPAHGVARGILPVMGLYGANASGKSNVLRGLARMVGHVLQSHAALKPTEPMPYEPFRLDQEHAARCTRFDVDVLVEGIRYHYGFAHDGRVIHEEWLYAWPRRHKQLWFHRQGADRATWHLGPGLTGQRARIAELTRDNSLFLSAAAQNNHPQLTALYVYFESRYAFLTERDLHEPVLRSESPLFDAAARPRLARLVRAADLGVADLKIEDRRDLVDGFVRELRTRGNSELAAEYEKRLAEEAPQEIVLGHTGRQGSLHWLPSQDESTGTITLLNALHDVLPVLDIGGVLTIDELDRGLHPDLCRALLRLFTDSVTNPRGAQLLFTTHAQALLEDLRRDEVIIVEKSPDGATVLTPVSDFKTLRRDNLRAAYAEGRFGGIPRLRLGRAIAEPQ